jgi:short-subunit dehydrogenase
MSRTLSGKRVIITGASSGIGRALSVALAESGCHLVLAARSTDKLVDLVRSLGGKENKIIAVSGDVTVDEDRKRIVQAAIEQLGGIDLLINNAGIASWGQFDTSDEHVLREVMEVNFFAPVELTRLALPHLTRGNEPAIVNVSSMCGRKAMPAWPEYSASKFALCGMTEAWRAEFGRFDVDVILIVPGLTKTDLREHMLRNDGKAQIDYDRGLPPETVAAKIVKAIRKNKKEVVIGSDAKWMLRMHRWLPRMLDRMICKRIKRLYEQPEITKQI